MSEPKSDVTIVGAGPYGLSAAAHLAADSRISVRVYGDPMSFWRDHMPAGMLLRSPYVASQFSDPAGRLTLDAYQEATGAFDTPTPLDRFVDYGRWFQSEAVADVEHSWVSNLERENGHFRVTLQDGRQTASRSVVIAAGIGPFKRIPRQFAQVPSSLASHAADHADLSVFAGRRVAVIGGGQSGLESAALLHEAGASVEVIVRRPQVHFLGRAAWAHKHAPFRWLYAPADVGPAGVSRLVSAPRLYGCLPRALQEKWGVRAVRPAGAGWLGPRLEQVPITVGRSIVGVDTHGSNLSLRLDDQSTRSVDHVLLATGYELDVAKYGFLAPSLLDRIERADGRPRLSSAFETSVPGLFMVGAVASWRYGPLMKFVAGAEFTSPVVAAAVRRRLAGYVPTASSPAPRHAT